jgi:hypothetical protein
VARIRRSRLSLPRSIIVSNLAASSLLYRLQHMSLNGALAVEQGELEFRQNFSLAVCRAIARQLRLAIRVQDATQTPGTGGWP